MSNLDKEIQAKIDQLDTFFKNEDELLSWLMEHQATATQLRNIRKRCEDLELYEWAAKVNKLIIK